MFNFRRLDAITLVNDLNPHPPGADEGAQRNRGSRRRLFRRVTQQIVQDLVDAIGIGEDAAPG